MEYLEKREMFILAPSDFLTGYKDYLKSQGLNSDKTNCPYIKKIFQEIPSIEVNKSVRINDKVRKYTCFHHKELIEYLEKEFFKGRDEAKELELDKEDLITYKKFIMDETDSDH